MLSINRYLQSVIETIPEKRRYDEPFLVVYPRHPNRIALLAYLLEDGEDTVHYYALDSKDNTLVDFLKNFANDAQFPGGFGDQLQDVLKKKNKRPEEMAEALANDLNALYGKSYVLVLDELDHVQHDQGYQAFFLTLSEHLADRVQLIINGRELLRHPWNEIIQQGRGRAIGDDNALGHGIFSVPSDIGIVEFYSLTGDIRILSDGYHVTAWDGALPRNLCYYFIEKERATRDQIFEDFWPHLGVKEATNVFHVTKRKISEKLGYDITNYTSGFYELSKEIHILYDAREFEAAYDAAMNSHPTNTQQKWVRAVYLYRYPYLAGLDLDWVEQKREDLRNKYVQALIELGRHHEADQELGAALGYYLRAVAENPVREDVHCSIMSIYNKQGRQQDIKRQYKLLERELKRNLSIEPSQKTKALYDAFLTGTV